MAQGVCGMGWNAVRAPSCSYALDFALKQKKMDGNFSQGPAEEFWAHFVLST